MKHYFLLFILAFSFSAKAAKPNIIFILTDDQRGSTVHGIEKSEIQTPNTDKLSEGGISFTNSYLFGANNGAVCRPSRAQLMTGRTFFQLPECLTAGWAPLPPGHDNPLQYKTFPEVLKENGYNTFATGKQHNGTKWIEVGFSHSKALFLGGMGSHYKLRLKEYSETNGWKSYNSKGVFSSEVFANAAIDFLNEQKNSEKPFMMYVAFTAPHDPRTPPKAYSDQYSSEKTTLPPNYKAEHPFPIASMRIRDEKLAPFPRPQGKIKEEIAKYYSMITATDHHMGRILDTLEKTGKAENTIIIYSSDNGLAVGQHGLMGKQNIYEHSVNLPMIIKGPGIAKGKKSSAMVYLHDLAPTICELAGVQPPKSMTARSFLPQIKNPTSAGRAAVYSAYDSWRWERGQVKVEGKKRRFEPRGHGRSIRMANFKLLLYHMNGKTTTLLFDLQKDPWELNNLAQSPEQKERISSMLAELQKQMKQAGDYADFNNKDWGYPSDRSR